jgi:hypothetical protein
LTNNSLQCILRHVKHAFSPNCCCFIVIIKHDIAFSALIDVLQAHLLQGDVLLAMGDYCATKDAYANGLDLGPFIRQSKSFKVWIRDLPSRHYKF